MAITNKQKENMPLMIYKQKQFPALRIVIQSAQTVWNEKLRRNEKTPGEYVDFVNYNFYARTKKEVDAVEAYREKNPNEIVKIDPKILEREARIRKEAEKIVDREMAKEAEEKVDPEAEKRKKEAGDQAVQDKHDKDQAKEEKKAEKKRDADRKITDKATEEAIADAEKAQEEAGVKEKIDYTGMSNADLIKLAQERKIELAGSDKRNKKSLLSAITAGFKKLVSGGSNEPDLTDQSES